MYLFDTNIISEFRKRQPNAGVLKFYHDIEARGIPFLISVISIGEIIRGIENLKRNGDFAQADSLEGWYQNEIAPISYRAIPFDLRAAQIWGEMIAQNPHNLIDKQIAATAIAHNLILVTRNVKDIENTGVKFINPFE